MRKDRADYVRCLIWTCLAQVSQDGARIVRCGRYAVFQVAKMALLRAPVRRDPAPDRRAVTIACVGHATGGNAMVAEADGGAVAEVCQSLPNAAGEARRTASGRSRRW